jgi:hypothetical protein
MSSVNIPHDHAVTLHDISEALVAAGYTSLDKQAKALGIHRATAWTIIKDKHKFGRLNNKTTERILASPNTPPSVRAMVQQYIAQQHETFPYATIK